MRRLNIAFAIDLLEHGGIQHQLLEVVRHLTGRGHSCTVLCFRAERASMADSFRESGSTVTFLGKKRAVDPSFFLRLRRNLSEGEFDVIQAMTPQATAWVASAKALCPAGARSVPLLSSFLNTHEFHSSAKAFVERNVVQHAAVGVVANSRAGASVYRNSVGTMLPVHIIRNGVFVASPPDAFTRNGLRKTLGLSDTDFAWCAVGRLVRVKGHDVLLDAFERLLRATPGELGPRLFIFGDGAELGRLLSRFGALVARGSVVLAGERADVRNLLPAFDGFVLPSRSEGMPNVLLEAMATRLPCVATDVGGVAEVIADGENGTLVPPGDPQRLAQAMSVVMADPDRAARLAATGWQTAATRFPMARMLRRTEGLFRRVASHHTNPPRRGVCVVVSQFPRLTETFILREIVEMRARGIAMNVVSLKDPPAEGAATHGDAERLRNSAICPPWPSVGTAIAAAAIAARHPLRFGAATFRLATLEGARPIEIAKALAVWPRAVVAVGLARRCGAAHIHAHWATIPTSCAAAAASLFGLSYSFTAHAHDIHRVPMALGSKIAGARFVATCTERNARVLRGVSRAVDAGRIHVVRHFPGGAVERAHPPTWAEGVTRQPLILAVGALEPYKGFGVLLRAAALLRAKWPAIIVRIVGGGELDAPLRAEAVALGLTLGEVVQFAGPLDQDSVLREMARASVFALPSVRTSLGPEDNLPNVLVEAALCRLPIVASRLGSVEELVVDGVTGLLVEPGDAQTLAAGLDRVLTDYPLALARADSARRTAEHLFSTANNASMLESLYRRVLADGPDSK